MSNSLVTIDGRATNEPERATMFQDSKNRFSFLSVIRHSSWGISSFLLMAVFSGCQGSSGTAEGESAKKSAEPGVEYVLAKPRVLRETIEVSGSVLGYEEAKIVARIQGYVGRVLVNIGQEVKQGELLAELDVPELHAEVDRRERLVDKAQADLGSRQAEIAQAQARFAELSAFERLRQSQLSRISNLVQGGALKQEKLDEAQYAVEAAKAAISRGQADIQTAEARLQSVQAELKVAEAEKTKSQAMAEYTRIVAPFDGLITSRNVDPGALVQPATGDNSTSLFEITSVGRVRIVVHLPMEDAIELSDGDEALLHSIPSIPGKSQSGTVARHAKAFHQGSRMMRAEIDLENQVSPDTGRRPLMPGDYGKVTLALKKYEDIVSVDKGVIAERNGTSEVMVIDERNELRIRTVKVVVEDGEFVGIASGLNSGDKVVTGDISRFDHGQQVTSATLIDN